MTWGISVEKTTAVNVLTGTWHVAKDLGRVRGETQGSVPKTIRLCKPPGSLQMLAPGALFSPQYMPVVLGMPCRQAVRDVRLLIQNAYLGSRGE